MSFMSHNSHKSKLTLSYTKYKQIKNSLKVIHVSTVLSDS